MPIKVACEKCGKVLKAPDAAAGKKAKCPSCGHVMRLPEAAAGVTPLAEPEPLPDPEPNPLGEALSYELAAPKGAEPVPVAAPPSAEPRRPCPACGEMIPVKALKCRFCGEVFDKSLKGSALGKPAAGSRPADGPQGLGGWLILPMIGLVLSPILWAATIGIDALALVAPADPNNPDPPGLATILVIEIGIAALMFLLTIYAAILFFGKRSSLPGVMTLLYGSQVVVSIIMLVMVSNVVDEVPADTYRDVTRSVMAACIWIPYFRVSKRVRNTFVN